MLSGAFSSLWSEIEGWFGGLVDDALNWGSNMISGFIDGMLSKPGEIASAAGEIMSSIGGRLKFWSPAKEGEGRYIDDWGANMISGFLDGALSKQREAGKAMDNIINEMKPNRTDEHAFNVKGDLMTNGQVNQSVEHEIKNPGDQPASINLRIGNNEFTAFVEDISGKQGQLTDLEMQF